MNTQHEAREQASFFRIARLLLPKDRKCLLFASMNGVKLKSPQAANRAKAQGMVKGVPDIQLAWPRGGYPGLFIEMKRTKEQGTSSVSDAQKDMLATLKAVGYKTAVCYGCDEAMEVLKKYLKGE